MPSPRRAAWCISFFGMHPTLTQVPPRPHVVPCGVGFTKSQTATFLPYLAAAFEQARPPEPPPITCARQDELFRGALVVPLTFSGAGLAAGARTVRVAWTLSPTAAWPNDTAVPADRAL